MPTVLRAGPFRVYFYSDESNEPPHVHVDRDDQSAKFWLSPVSFVRNCGFSEVELRRIADLLEHHERQLLEAWHEWFED